MLKERCVTGKVPARAQQAVRMLHMLTGQCHIKVYYVIFAYRSKEIGSNNPDILKACILYVGLGKFCEVWPVFVGRHRTRNTAKVDGGDPASRACVEDIILLVHARTGDYQPDILWEHGSTAPACMLKKIGRPGDLYGKFISFMTCYHCSRDRTRKKPKVNHTKIGGELSWPGTDEVFPVVSDEENPVPWFNHAMRAS
jgi:hypothetical protein